MGHRSHLKILAIIRAMESQKGKGIKISTVDSLVANLDADLRNLRTIPNNPNDLVIATMRKTFAHSLISTLIPFTSPSIDQKGAPDPFRAIILESAQIVIDESPTHNDGDPYLASPDEVISIVVNDLHKLQGATIIADRWETTRFLEAAAQKTWLYFTNQQETLPSSPTPTPPNVYRLEDIRNRPPRKRP